VRKSLRVLPTDLVDGLTKPTKLCSFPWASSSCSPSSACTSLLLIHYPKTHMPSPRSVIKFIRRDKAPNRVPNLVGFSILLVLSLVGAIGLTIRGASRSGKGLCEDFADTHPEKCTQAAVAMTFTWIAVSFGASSTSPALHRVNLNILFSPRWAGRFVVGQEV